MSNRPSQIHQIESEGNSDNFLLLNKHSKHRRFIEAYQSAFGSSELWQSVAASIALCKYGRRLDRKMLQFS